MEKKRKEKVDYIGDRELTIKLGNPCARGYKRIQRRAVGEERGFRFCRRCAINGSAQRKADRHADTQTRREEGRSISRSRVRVLRCGWIQRERTQQPWTVDLGKGERRATRQAKKKSRNYRQRGCTEYILCISERIESRKRARHVREKEISRLMMEVVKVRCCGDAEAEGKWGQWGAGERIIGE